MVRPRNAIYFYEEEIMSNDPGERPDVTEMLAVHNALRDTLDAAPELVRGVAAGDTDRVALLSNFYANVLSFLHVHHEGEDVLIFPNLVQRCPDQIDLINGIAAQHHDVDDLVSRSEKSLEDWSSGQPGAQERAAVALGELGEGLTEHLGQEEREILPLCSEHISQAEWSSLPGHAMANFKGDKPWLALGLVMERFSPEQQQLVASTMPPPAVEMWVNFGQPAFTGLMSKVGSPLG